MKIKSWLAYALAGILVFLTGIGVGVNFQNRSVNPTSDESMDIARQANDASKRAIYLSYEALGLAKAYQAKYCATREGLVDRDSCGTQL